MTLHTGSSHFAHQLNRFSHMAAIDDRHDREFVAGEAARLNVSIETIERYLDWYGCDAILVRRRGLYDWLPAYEIEIRIWQLGERLTVVDS